MSIDNIRKNDSGLTKRPITSNDNNGIYIWTVIGCSIGGAVILTTIIVCIIYFTRKNSKKKTLELDSPRYISGSEFSYKQTNSSNFSSTESDDETISKTSSLQKCPSLGHCTPLDTPNLLRVTSEYIQPKQAAYHWQAVSFQQYQPSATVPASLERQPEEYRESDSAALSSSTALNGRLWFSVSFRPDDDELKITLIKAKHLPGRGLAKSPRDPYVKIFLLPDEETYQQSKIRKRTLSPKFNETFTFKVNLEDLTGRSIRFSVYDVDKRKVRHNLGHVTFPLTQSSLLDGQVIWRDLDTTTQQFSSMGEIQLSLGYNPYTKRIKVVVASVRNIQGITAEDDSIYVKVQLYHGHKLMKSKKTTAQSITCDRTPEQQEWQFDETFNFGVSGRFFDSCSFIFTIMFVSPSRLTKDKAHCRIVIGPFMYARGDQLQHWQEMLSNRHNLVTKWHNLEPLISS